MHEALTGKIIGCCMRVHTSLGCGFQEAIYNRCLQIEFRCEAINHICEKELAIHYRNEIVGHRRVDFFVEDKVLLEIKAVSNLENVHLAQALNYLEAFQMPIGLLINFGSKSLQFKRLYNNKIIQSLNQENQGS
ncbi:MAG: GxxExxY protein [Flavisolibacter sp.]